MPSAPGEESFSPSRARESSSREKGESKRLREGSVDGSDGSEERVGAEGGASLLENASNQEEGLLDEGLSMLQDPLNRLICLQTREEGVLGDKASQKPIHPRRFFFLTNLVKEAAERLYIRKFSTDIHRE